MKKKAAFYTLGCKVNYCETESLQELFLRAGYRVTSFDSPADVYVINTCTVTGASDHKSRKAIRRARRRSPGAVVVATGCYAQGFSAEIRAMGEADLVVGNRDRENLPLLVEQVQRDGPLDMVRPYAGSCEFELLPPNRLRGRTRGFLKIQEGCDQTCSYCVVPRVRGPLRSMPPEEVLQRAKALAASGCKEIVLSGVHLGLYGAGLDRVSLAVLLRQLENVPGLLRLRLSSLEPSDINNELIEQILNSELICPHLHIPLQSGDEEILGMMNRPYAPVEYLYLAKWLQQEIPGLALSSDIMVGFPGETERHHRRSMALVREIGFSSLHVFQYSPRPGTTAATLPGEVPGPVKEQRSKEMIALGSELASSYRRRFIGSLQTVLVEKVVPYAYGEGFTPNYLRVRVKAAIKALHWRGRLVRARLETENDNHIGALHVRKGSR